LHGVQGVGGSNPLAPTNSKNPVFPERNLLFAIRKLGRQKPGTVTALVTLLTVAVPRFRLPQDPDEHSDPGPTFRRVDVPPPAPMPDKPPG
jgi:hypothetical protein